MNIYEKKYTGIALKVGGQYLCYGSDYTLTFGAWDKYYLGKYTRDIIVRDKGKDADEISGFLDFSNKLTDDKIISQCQKGEIVEVELSKILKLK